MIHRWDRRLGAGLFLSSLSLLALELVLVRIFSVLMWYHFVSLVISLALLGLTAGGLVVFLFPRSFPPERADVWLGRFALLLSLAVIAEWLLLFAVQSFPRLSYRVLSPFHQPFHGPFGPIQRDSFSLETLAPLAGIIAFSLIPFLFGGFVATLSISRFTRSISRVYFADLAGAGTGCIVAILLLTFLDPFRALAAIAAVAAFAALLFFGRDAAPAWRLSGATVMVLGLALAAAGGGLVELHIVGGRYEPEILWSRWNSYSRVAVFPTRSGQAEGSWGMSRNFRGEAPRQLGMVVDDTAYSSIARHDPAEDPAWARATLFSLPYLLRPRAESLLIGPGGGKDILVARSMGSGAIRAVELNPLMITAVQERFGDFSGRPYSLPGVTTVVDEGRTYLKRDGSRYDIIQATVVGRLATQAGALTLAEDHLYTIEAFRDYLDRLKPDGILAISRFLFEKRFLRMVATAREALARRGAKDPGSHIFIASERGMGAMLVKEAPFTPKEAETLESRCRDLGFTVLHSPFREGSSPFHRLLGERDVLRFYRSLDFDISPVTDDRPFFYYMVRPADFLRVFTNRAGADFDDRALILIRNIILLLSLAVALLLVLPLAFNAGGGKVGGAGTLPVLVFFSALGLGFVVVEITLLKRFFLLLGKPVYSVAVILSAFLVAGGIGSYRARNAKGGGRFLRRRCLLIAALLLILTFLLPFVVEAALPLPLGARLLVTLLAVAPAGYFMGQPFPLGIGLLRQSREALVPWVWSVNGSLSVLGSMLTLVMAINFGYTATMLVGPAAYIAAAVAAERL